jgi:hypothetical protein
MDNIRISNSNKKIQVNDEGEYIVLPFSDQSFPNRYYKMIDGFTEMKKEIDSKAKEVVTEREIVVFISDIHQKAKEDIDMLLGADTCKKVFGDIVPSIEMIQEFFEKLLPFFQAYSEERKKEINRKFNTAGKKKM